jgi:AAA+ ATPase superfamily predicted ATPase
MIDLSGHYFKNTYIAGNAVKSEKMFFGRDEIFSSLHAHLLSEHANRPILIYGQRRMGKTSVLHQMERRLNAHGQGYLTVLIDWQGFTLRGVDNFWYELADAIHWKLSDQYQLPSFSESISSLDAHHLFCHHFLPMVLSSIGPRRLVLMFDESLRLEEVMREERLPKSIFDDLLTLMEQQRQISFIYSLACVVSNLLPEHKAIFKVALSLHVTFLNEKAARALVTEPVAKFYEFDEDAIDYLLALTSRHAYFTQMLCSALFFRWKWQQLTRITAADVFALLNDAINSAMINIHYLWQEATIAEKVVLAAMAEMEADEVSVSTLERRIKQAGIYTILGSTPHPSRFKGSAST